MTGSESPSSADVSRWIFRNDGKRPGAEQMAIDAALLEEAADSPDTFRPIFRIYDWAVPTVSLGFHQTPERELDMNLVRSRGYDVVKRPTGGRAILHIDELTYAIVARIDDPFVGGSIRDSHCKISQIFRDALRLLGVPAFMASEVSGVCEPVSASDSKKKSSETSIPCFATAAGTELVVSGKKILGSAQRRKGEVFLQHGSLMLGDGHLELAELLNLPHTSRMDWRKTLEGTTTSILRETGRRVTLVEAAEALRKATPQFRG